MPPARLSPSMSLLKCQYALATLTIIPFSRRLWTWTQKDAFVNRICTAPLIVSQIKRLGVCLKECLLVDQIIKLKYEQMVAQISFPFEGFHRFFYVAFIAYELNDLRVINSLMYNVVLCYLLSLTTLLLWPRHLSPHLQRERLFYSSPRLSCSV